MDSKKTVYPYIPNSAPDVQAEMMAEVGISDVMEPTKKYRRPSATRVL